MSPSFVGTTRRGPTALIVALLLCLGCGGGEPAKPAKPLALALKPAACAPGQKGQATATGGTAPYRYAVAEDNTGSTIAAKGGKFTAGRRAGTDTLRVTDAAGATADAELTVRAPLALEPATSSCRPGATVELRATGGAAPYTFTFPVGGNVSGGRVEARSGRYTAGRRLGVDRIQVSDTTGGTASASVTVEAPLLVIDPTAAECEPGAALVFAASGGVPPYAFALTASASGGRLDADGNYVAGAVPGTDTVRVSDAAGQAAEARVTVLAQPVVLAPLRATVEPRQPLIFTAAGGRPPYRFEVRTDSSKGRIDPLSGQYTAGRYDGTDFVAVLDADDRAGLAQVRVYLPPLELDPLDGRVFAGQSITFRALGGLPPFRWEVDGPRGGTLLPDRDGRTARYVAPDGVAEAGARARIRVKDGAEPAQATSAAVDIRPLPPEGAGDPAELVAPTATPRGRRGPVAQLPVRTQLKNGLVVIVEENHTRPVCCVSLAIAGGSAIDPPGKAGLTTLCTDLFGEGSKRLARGQFRETFRNVGGQAWTNNMPTESFTDRAAIEIEVRPAHLRLALETLAKAFLEPAPTPEVVATVRDQWVQMATQRETQPTQKGWEALCGLCFAGHAYEHPWEGTLEGLRAITPADAEAHLRLMASPARATLVISGDIGRKDALDLATRCFGDAAPGQKAAPRPPLPELLKGPRRRTVTVPGGQATVFVGFTVPGLMHPDRVAVELLTKLVEYQVLLDILAVKRVGDHAMVNVDLFAELGVIWCMVVCEPAKLADAEAAVLAAVATVRDGDGAVPAATRDQKWAADVEREKQRLVTEEMGRRERARHRAFNLARAESAAGIRYALGVLQRIRNATPSHVTEAARQYLRLENLSVARVVPEGTPELTDAERGRVEAAQQRLHTALKFTASFGKRLYTDQAVTEIFDDRGRLAEDWTSDAGRTLETELGNGLRVICREDRAVPLVNLGFYTSAGTARDWRGRGGLAQIMFSLPWRGTVRRDGDQLHQTVLKHGFLFTSEITPDYSAIVATSMAEHAETLARLLGEVLSVPQLPQQPYLDLWRQQMSRIAQEKEIPQVQARNAVRAALYAGHPYGYATSGDPQALQQCSAWEAYELAHRTMRPSETTVVAVGDLPAEQLLALVRKALADWVPAPTVGEGELWKIWTAHAQPGSALTVPIRGATVCEVMRAVPAPPLGHTDYPALEMLRWMLEFRVKRDLQETRGLTTNVLVQYHAWAHGGLIEAAVTTTPEHRDEVAERLAAHLTRLRDEPVGLDEVQHIRDWIAAKEVRDQQTGATIAIRLGTYARLGAGVNYAERFFYELSKITPMSLQQVAKKYLAADAQVAVLAGAVK